MAWTFVGSVIFPFFSFWEDYYWLEGLFLLRGSVSASWRGLNDCRSADDLLTIQIIATYLSYFESLICSLTDTLDLFFNDYWCLQFFLFDDKLIVSFVHWLTDRLLSLLAEINLLVCSVNTSWLLFYLFFFLIHWLAEWSTCRHTPWLAVLVSSPVPAWQNCSFYFIYILLFCWLAGSGFTFSSSGFVIVWIWTEEAGYKKKKKTKK